MKVSPDIAVIGLGPAGACAASRAAAEGWSVVAIDRRQRPGWPVQCAEFVPAALDMELPDLDVVTVQAISRMETWVETEGAPRAPVVTRGFGGRMLDRAAFDTMLVARAAKAGALCLFGTCLREVLPDGSLRLDTGMILEPRLIIGADGPRSPVGRAIGAVNHELVETRQMRLALLRPHDATDIFLSRRIPGGYGWLFPRGESCNLGVGVAASERGALKGLLDDLAQKLAAEGRVGRLASHHTGGAIPVGGMVGPWGRLERVPVLLAGDAAGLANPVTGGGIVAAVQSGGLAGEAAHAYLSGDPAALEDYEDELVTLFGASLTRALNRRRALLARWRAGGLDDEALKAGWIAFDSYWTGTIPQGFGEPA